MINLYFGDIKDALWSGDTYFDHYMENWGEAIESDFGRKIIKSIDGSEVYDRNLIVSPIFGGIPPEKLAGGTKALLILMFTNQIVDLAAMGDNCFPYLFEIGASRDITVCSDHPRVLYRERELIKHPEIKIVNTGNIVTDGISLVEEYMKCLRENK